LDAPTISRAAIANSQQRSAKDVKEQPIWEIDAAHGGCNFFAQAVDASSPVALLNVASDARLRLADVYVIQPPEAH